MKIVTAIFTLIIAAEGVSFFDVVLEEWNLYKVGKLLLCLVYLILLTINILCKLQT